MVRNNTYGIISEYDTKNIESGLVTAQSSLLVPYASSLYYIIRSEKFNV